VIIGQEQVIEQLAICLFARGQPPFPLLRPAPQCIHRLR
jgi:hypothetical protein